MERVIEGEDCVKTFVKELKDLTEEDTREVIVIAHNLQAYDGYFVIEELYRDGKSVKQIRAGAKIIELRHYGIKFIDSLNFFSMSLSDFPKTFGLKLYAKDAAGRLIRDEDGNYQEHPLAKGFFPHLFNHVENQQYVGPLPPRKDYMPLTMSKDKKKEFDQWYEDQIKQVDEQNPHHYIPKTGNYLGEFTDELVDKKTGISHPVIEFVSAGPKNYGYEQSNGKRECKVKGFSLNTEGSRYLNYDVMRENVLAELTNPLLDVKTGHIIPRKHQVKRTHRIVRDPKDLSIQTVAEIKNYSIVYEKRVIDLNTYLTYPYGYGELDTTHMEEDIHTLLDL